MKICDEDHDEIVYDSRNCPLCEKIGELKSLEEELNKCQEQSGEQN